MIDMLETNLVDTERGKAAVDIRNGALLQVGQPLVDEMSEVDQSAELARVQQTIAARVSGRFGRQLILQFDRVVGAPARVQTLSHHITSLCRLRI